MSADKTEEPTAKKLADARARGEAPKSSDLVSALVLLAVLGGLTYAGPNLEGALTSGFRDVLSLVSAKDPRMVSAGALLEALLASALSALAPVLIAAWVTAIAASVVQTGPLLSFRAIAPDTARIDPVQGAKNLFSRRKLVALAKSTVKIAIVALVTWQVARDAAPFVVTLSQRDAAATLAGATTLVFTLALRCGGALVAIGILDVFYERFQFLRDQRMTKDERKREHRESEGDPHAKRQRERAHREIVAHGTLEAVRTADVLVVNPTHYAIALRYDAEAEQGAPEITAKGQDDLAQRMIRAAEEAGVPVLRDVPLAHSLFTLELGEEIPEALYEAVAIVLRAAWEERERAS